MMNMDPTAAMAGPPPALPNEPMGPPPDPGAMPEALDPDMALEMMVAGTGGVLADYMRKKQLMAINELSAQGLMGQAMETLDGPAGMEGMPDDELLAQEMAMSESGEPMLPPDMPA
jgi:hypothetical protein